MEKFENSSIVGKRRKIRNSNVEFIRILAMFMILMLHANFFSISAPTPEECHVAPVESFTRIALELFCIISVNLFVMISGWFGIKAKVKGFAKFIFQCVFILGAVYLIGVAAGYTRISGKGVLEVFFATGLGWFIKAYAFLYILSPVLNSFFDNSSEKVVRNFLLAFYAFQTIYGNIFHAEEYFSTGYSAFSFIGVYILARYLNKYGQRFYRYGLGLYVVCMGVLILSYFTLRYLGLNGMLMLMYYTNPLNILACAGLIMWVMNQPVRRNRFVNMVGASAFAVYLCHNCLTWTVDKYKYVCKTLFDDYSGIEFLGVIFLFLVGVFIASIILDQFRKAAWHFVERVFAKDQ